MYNLKDLEDLFKEYGIEDKNVLKESKEKLKKIIKIIEKQKPSNAVLWDECVRRYCESASKLFKVLDDENIKNRKTEGIKKHLEEFVKGCRRPEFQIALVGAIKAGKSTLINALLGMELSAVATTPETASLTRFKATKENSCIRVSFYSKKEWEVLWKSAKEAGAEVFLEEYKNLRANNEKNKWLGQEPIRKEISNNEIEKELKVWTSSKEAKHYFVKEVTVEIKGLNLPEEVVFVDTPGLDDPVEYRSNITRKYIDKANATLVCVKANALNGSELSTISKVFANSMYYPEKIYVIGTQIDALNTPKKQWAEQKKEWVKHLKRKGYYGSGELAEKNIIETGAHLYNICNKYGKETEDERKDLQKGAINFDVDMLRIKDNLELLKKHTNIENLKKVLSERVIKIYKEILLKDIEEKYEINKKEVIELFSKIKNEKKEYLEIINEDLEGIRKRKEIIEKELEENRENQKGIEEAFKCIKEKTDEVTKKLYKELRNVGV